MPEPPLYAGGRVRCPACGWSRRVSRRALARYRAHWRRKHPRRPHPTVIPWVE